MNEDIEVKNVAEADFEIAEGEAMLRFFPLDGVDALHMFVRRPKDSEPADFRELTKNQRLTALLFGALTETTEGQALIHHARSLENWLMQSKLPIEEAQKAYFEMAFIHPSGST